jgi:hypothetical protein
LYIVLKSSENFDNCPNSAFDKFSDDFSTMYNLHFALKTVKFNKNFHKKDPWMTSGISDNCPNSAFDEIIEFQVKLFRLLQNRCMLFSEKSLKVWLFLLGF